MFKCICLQLGIDTQSLADNIVTQDNRLLLLDKHLEGDAHWNFYSVGFNEMLSAQVWLHIQMSLREALYNHNNNKKVPNDF